MASHLKSLFLPSYYEKESLTLPDVQFTKVPSRYTVNKSRRKVPFANKDSLCSLYLTAAKQPSEPTKEIAEVPESNNQVEVDLPTKEILNSINSAEKSIHEKISQLQNLGTDKYLQQKLNASMKAKKGKNVNLVDYPGDLRPSSASVTEVKEAKKRKTSKLKKDENPLTLIEHHASSSNKKRKKKNKF